MRLLALIGFLAIVVAIAAGVFFFGGFFNVAATNPVPAPVSWALIKVRMAAVDRYATDRVLIAGELPGATVIGELVPRNEHLVVIR